MFLLNLRSFTSPTFTCGEEPGAVSSLLHTLQDGSVIIYSPWPLASSISAWSTPSSVPGTGDSRRGVTVVWLWSVWGESEPSGVLPVMQRRAWGVDPGSTLKQHTDTTEEHLSSCPSGVHLTRAVGSQTLSSGVFFHGGLSV